MNIEYNMRHMQCLSEWVRVKVTPEQELHNGGIEFPAMPQAARMLGAKDLGWDLMIILGCRQRLRFITEGINNEKCKLFGKC